MTLIETFRNGSHRSSSRAITEKSVKEIGIFLEKMGWKKISKSEKWYRREKGIRLYYVEVSEIESYPKLPNLFFETDPEFFGIKTKV